MRRKIQKKPLNDKRKTGKRKWKKHKSKSKRLELFFLLCKMEKLRKYIAKEKTGNTQDLSAVLEATSK